MLILLSASLSLDAFAVGAAHGLRATKIPILSKLIICLISILYFGLAIWLGERISAFLSPAAAKMIGIILMSGICLWMLMQVLLDKKPDEIPGGSSENTSKTLFELPLSSIGLTFKIIRNPMLCDIDKSKSIGSVEALFLGTALSVDSISVGIGYSLLGHVSIFAPLMVGLFQFAFLSSGCRVGSGIHSFKLKNPNRLQIISVAVMFVLVIVRIFC